MFIQEKKYLALWKTGEKLAKAGLLKLSIWDNRVKAEYFLNTLPIYYASEAKCILIYRLADDTEKRTTEWKFQILENQPQYSFHMQTSGTIAKVEDCQIILNGNYVIGGERNPKILEVQMSTLEAADTALEATDTALETAESALEASESALETSECEREDSLNAEILENKSQKKTEKVSDTEKVRNIEYVQDLHYLLGKGGRIEELYYNSFLLHGYYQYRHFIYCDDFIGVPGNFYEREAIAAKIMGFPFFIEAEYLETCNFTGEARQEQPRTGSYGYYLQNM